MQGFYYYRHMDSKRRTYAAFLALAIIAVLGFGTYKVFPAKYWAYGLAVVVFEVLRFGLILSSIILKAGDRRGYQLSIAFSAILTFGMIAVGIFMYRDEVFASHAATKLAVFQLVNIAVIFVEIAVGRVFSLYNEPYREMYVNTKQKLENTASELLTRSKALEDAKEMLVETKKKMDHAQQSASSRAAELSLSLSKIDKLNAKIDGLVEREKIEGEIASKLSKYGLLDNYFTDPLDRNHRIKLHMNGQGLEIEKVHRNKKQ